uniref:Uncharacterized protein n=1 Tax=Solanum lycopersicum TaxID=4081 RepID=A0A3Q7HYK8_SOLLC
MTKPCFLSNITGRKLSRKIRTMNSSGTNTWIKIPETRTTSIGLFTFHKFLQFISMLLFPFEISVDTMNQNIFSL